MIHQPLPFKLHQTWLGLKEESMNVKPASNSSARQENLKMQLKRHLNSSKREYTTQAHWKSSWENAKKRYSRTVVILTPERMLCSCCKRSEGSLIKIWRWLSTFFLFAPKLWFCFSFITKRLLYVLIYSLGGLFLTQLAATKNSHENLKWPIT